MKWAYVWLFEHAWFVSNRRHSSNILILNCSQTDGYGQIISSMEDFLCLLFIVQTMLRWTTVIICNFQLNGFIHANSEYISEKTRTKLRIVYKWAEVELIFGERKPVRACICLCSLALHNDHSRFEKR